MGAADGPGGFQISALLTLINSAMVSETAAGAYKATLGSAKRELSASPGSGMADAHMPCYRQMSVPPNSHVQTKSPRWWCQKAGPLGGDEVMREEPPGWG